MKTVRELWWAPLWCSFRYMHATSFASKCSCFCSKIHYQRKVFKVCTLQCYVIAFFFEVAGTLPQILEMRP